MGHGCIAIDTVAVLFHGCNGEALRCVLYCINYCGGLFLGRDGKY